MVVVERFVDAGGAKALRADLRVIEECGLAGVPANSQGCVTGTRTLGAPETGAPAGSVGDAPQ